MSSIWSSVRISRGGRASHRISLTDAGGEIVLVLDPSRESVVVDPGIPGATVHLNGAVVGSAPVTVTLDLCRENRVEIEARGFYPALAALAAGTLPAQARSAIAALRVRAAPPGRLILPPAPSPVRFLVNGRRVQRREGGVEVPAGRNSVRAVSEEHWVDTSETVDVPAGGTVKAPLDIPPMSSPPPGLGDEIQAIKAGNLEIADIHVVSKCDRDAANRTLTDLKQMLTLGALTQAKPLWQIPVIGVSSYSGQGIAELLARIVRHREVLASTGLGAQRRRRVAEFRLAKTAETMLIERFASGARGVAPPLARRLADRATDPYSAAQSLIAQTLRQEYADELA